METKKLTQELRQQVLNQLHSTPEWRQLMSKLQAEKTAFRLKNVAKLTQEMDFLEQECIRHYLEEIEEDSVELTSVFNKMSEQDRETFTTKVHQICFMCDVLDALIIDANSLVGKYAPDCKLNAYADLGELVKSARQQLSYILDNPDEKQKSFFCKYSDRIIKYADKQIRRFITRENGLKGKEGRSR